jgi:signal transduction histidine kinase
MAEVATSVLHNVGNVLNGANVLASSIASQVQRSEARGVSQLAALLAEHRTDLGRFLGEGDKGQLVCGHLDRLGSHLTKEQAQLAEKISRLSESLQHIKEIVAMQQNHARVYGVTETVSLAETVEDAIQMCSGGLARPDLKILRDYEDLPPVTLDRHKVLQILFNLLENARQACEAAGDGAKPQITVRLRRNGPERMAVQVRDNGIGIPPENLPKIFTQGFSTRRGGHGFGLHSSVLAAQDMGGSLHVQSDGPGRGATFTLELPLTPPAPATSFPAVPRAIPESSPA